MSPLDGVVLSTPPAFQWTTGPYDYFCFCTYFYYAGYGYFPYTTGWFPGTSLAMPQTWWTGLETGHPHFWAVLAASSSTGEWEVAGPWLFAGAAFDTDPFAVSVAESASTYNPEDIVEDNSFDHTIRIDFTANTAQLSSGTPQAITTEGVTVLTLDSTDVTITQTDHGVTVDSTVAPLVKYELTGELAGTLTVSSDSPYQLFLDDVCIEAFSGPALDLESSQKVFFVSAPGTVNTLADASTRSLTMKAALYGKGPMIFSGEGTISVSGSYKHGMFSKDYIRMRGGRLTVSVTERDGIRSENGFIFDDGSMTIHADGTTIDDESKGIKVEGDEGDGAGKGYIVLNGGYITITSVGKGMSAAWDIDDDAETEDTADDPSPYVEINNGVITVTTTGTPYETETASCSPEGIEAKSDLTLNNGFLTINTTEDSLNAGASITLNGGYLYCASSHTDAIDANGPLTIHGGVIVAIGASVPEGPFDCDQNTFTITGGTLVGIGGSISMPTASVCTQNVVILGRGAKGTTLALQAGDGSVPFAFTVPRAYGKMLLSTPDVATGTTYTVYTGGTASADVVYDGLFLDNLAYSGGTPGISFTVTSTVTNLGY